MSVQNLVNSTISTVSGAVSSDIKSARNAVNAEVSEVKRIRGLPTAKTTESARRSAQEQVNTRLSNNTIAKETMSERKKTASQEDAAEAIRALREQGYISGRQAKRAIYRATKMEVKPNE